MLARRGLLCCAIETHDTHALVLKFNCFVLTVAPVLGVARFNTDPGLHTRLALLYPLVDGLGLQGVGRLLGTHEVISVVCRR